VLQKKTMFFSLSFFSREKKFFFSLNGDSGRSRSNLITSPLTEKFILPSVPLRKITQRSFDFILLSDLDHSKSKKVLEVEVEGHMKGPVKRDYNTKF